VTTTLTVTKKGQITLKRDLLNHLGIKPGEQITLERLPAGQLRLHAARPAGSIERFIGLLAGKSDKILTVEEMNEIAARGWAGQE